MKIGQVILTLHLVMLKVEKILSRSACNNIEITVENYCIILL